MKLKEIIPITLVFAAGFFSIVLSGEPLVYGQLMFLAFFQNVAFLLVSRARNRNNSNYHFIAAVLSNGVWFMTYSYMVPRGMPWLMLVPFLSGTVLGSLFGAGVSQKIEKWLGLSAEASKQQNNRVLILCLVLAGTICIKISDNFQIVALMMTFAFLQNFGAAVSSRARSRNNFSYSTLAAMASGFLFLLSFRYLVVNNMPLSLFIPYTIGTVLGSIVGANTSAIFEKIFNIQPDTHLKKEGASKISFFGNNLFKIVVLTGLGFIMLQALNFGFFLGFPATTIPFTVLLVGSLVYFTQNATFSVASRAGNRNHVNYHLSARILNGIVTYLCFVYAVTNRMSFELFAPIILGQIAGSVTGQGIGMKIESKIGAYMDAPKKE